MAETYHMKPNVSNMHVILSILIVTFAWILSYTILFPLFITMKLSRRFRNKLFSLFYAHVLKIIGPNFNSLRTKVFEYLPADPTRKIKILEVGVGHGANFEYYPSNCELTLLDMNENFVTEIREELKKYPDLKVEKIAIGYVEDMKEIPDRSYDFVICTYLLCSVKDVFEVLKEISRVLKPDGKFLYAEHIGFPVSPIPRWIQTFLNPLWNVYGNGCNLNRLTYTMISQVFKLNSYQIYYPLSTPLILGVQAIGAASQPRLQYLPS